MAETRLAPDSYELRLLHVLFDAGWYPEPTAAARLGIRWFTTGGFSSHYDEKHDGETL